MHAGDEFCRVSDRHTMKARILVPDREFADVRPGSAVKVKVLPYAFRTYSGRVDQILPAAAADIPVSQTQRLIRLGQELTNHIAVIMEFPNPDNSLIGGMTGIAKIKTSSRPLRGRRAAPLGTGYDPRSGGHLPLFSRRSQKERAAVPGTAALGVAATSNSWPSGAQSRRSLKFRRSMLVPYHFTVSCVRTSADVLRSSFLPRNGFLALLHWLSGRIHDSQFLVGKLRSAELWI